MINITADPKFRLKQRVRKHYASAQLAIAGLFVVVLVVSVKAATAQSSEVLSLDAHVPPPDVKGRRLFVAVPAQNDRSAEIRVYQAH